MANVEDGTTAPAADGNLWGAQSQGKVTRRRVLAAGGVLGAAALGLGLYFGLKEGGYFGLKEESGSQTGQRNIISGQADPNSTGCFADKEGDERVMGNLWTDATMTPDVSICGWMGVVCIVDTTPVRGMPVCYPASGFRFFCLVCERRKMKGAS